jgi:iron complex transport system ATP-binding protein
MAGELEPGAGQVQLHGYPASDNRRHACYRAMLPQQSTLSFPFRVVEVVLMGRLPHLRARTERAEDWEIARAALAAAGMAAYADKRYTALSGGEQQRVQFARVLAQVWQPVAGRPRLLLLDEPIANLDPAFQLQILQEARQLAAAQALVVVSLHDLNMASLFADQILLLHDGHFPYQGAPAEVLTAPNLNQVYGLPFQVQAYPGRPERPLVLVPPG